MADGNSHPVRARTGGRVITVTGAPAAADRPDGQRSGAASATGADGHAKPHTSADVLQAGDRRADAVRSAGMNVAAMQQERRDAIAAHQAPAGR